MSGWRVINDRIKDVRAVGFCFSLSADWNIRQNEEIVSVCFFFSFSGNTVLRSGMWCGTPWVCSQAEVECVAGGWACALTVKLKNRFLGVDLVRCGFPFEDQSCSSRTSSINIRALRTRNNAIFILK